MIINVNVVSLQWRGGEGRGGEGDRSGETGKEVTQVCEEERLSETRQHVFH